MSEQRVRASGIHARCLLRTDHVCTAISAAEHGHAPHAGRREVSGSAAAEQQRLLEEIAKSGNEGEFN